MEANLQIAILLLKSGASVEIKSKDGKTPLDFVPKVDQKILLDAAKQQDD
jgi:hypothetical protein